MTGVALLLIAGGLAAVGWLLYEFARAPELTFDEHAATACALLQPDHPDLPARPLSFIEQVEAYLAEHAPKES